MTPLQRREELPHAREVVRADGRALHGDTIEREIEDGHNSLDFVDPRVVGAAARVADAVQDGRRAQKHDHESRLDRRERDVVLGPTVGVDHEERLLLVLVVDFAEDALQLGAGPGCLGRLEDRVLDRDVDVAAVPRATRRRRDPVDEYDGRDHSHLDVALVVVHGSRRDAVDGRHGPLPREQGDCRARLAHGAVGLVVNANKGAVLLELVDVGLQKVILAARVAKVRVLLALLARLQHQLEREAACVPDGRLDVLVARPKLHLEPAQRRRQLLGLDSAVGLLRLETGEGAPEQARVRDDLREVGDDAAVPARLGGEDHFVEHLVEAVPKFSKTRLTQA
mmetsp:Transcript_18482/g.63614  ORF Transcript_18482/g.63614 Transcript_18482/m.63614 type:complete len:338 (-) Transcript_18482:389-1402(-)